MVWRHLPYNPPSDAFMTYPWTFTAACCMALSLMLTACSHDYQLMKRSEQLNGYRSTIGWSQFKKSLNFHAHPPSPLPDWDALENIKVTAYEPLSEEMQADGKLMLQTVRIRYVHLDKMVEKAITDEQRWRYDDDKDRWLLETGLPQFK
jgi:hypothetical protein